MILFNPAKVGRTLNYKYGEHNGTPGTRRLAQMNEFYRFSGSGINLAERPKNAQNLAIPRASVTMFLPYHQLHEGVSLLTTPMEETSDTH